MVATQPCPSENADTSRLENIYHRRCNSTMPKRERESSPICFEDTCPSCNSTMPKREQVGVNVEFNIPDARCNSTMPKRERIRFNNGSYIGFSCNSTMPKRELEVFDAWFVQIYELQLNHAQARTLIGYGVLHRVYQVATQPCPSENLLFFWRRSS